MVVDLATPGRAIHAGVILTGGRTEMIDVAPFELFSALNKDTLKELALPDAMIEDGLDVKLHWVTENGDTALMHSGARIKPTDSFQTCPPLDIVLMGANDFQYRLSEGEKAFIRKSYEDCSAFLTICGGIMPMLESGLLEGKTVSAPRMIVNTMKQRVPVVNWVDKRYATDGKIWSSSSLLNGTDMMRAFAEHTWGGRTGMIEALLDAGHWPARDVDFKDFHGSNFAIESF